MPGPPPKPPAIRRRDGNPSKRPIVDEARVGSAVATVDAFAPPEYLRPAAVAVWNEIVPELVEIGLVRSVDTTAVEAMCDAVATAREAREILDAEGYVLRGHRGSVVHPAYRVWRDSWTLALRVAGEYGLTAVARLRVGAAVLHQRSLADELREALDGPFVDEGDVVDAEAEPSGVEALVAEIEADVATPKPKQRRRTK
jgi:P27 family predicted phage terminase small subunit